jgi:hypothetical protein
MTKKKLKGIQDAIINAEGIKQDETTITKQDFIDAFYSISRYITDAENIHIGDKLAEHLERIKTNKQNGK